jgi:uncharacterized phage-associated protein
MKTFILDKEKALTTLLFVSKELKDSADFHKIFKIIYFADQSHLKEYGRPIIGDTYLKMEYGPVPSFIRDLANGKIPELSDNFEIYEKHYVKPLIEPNLDYLSETDIECLQKSIEDNKNLSFFKLTNKSHDFAWENASWPIDYVDMLKSVSDDVHMLEYLKVNILNNNLAL